MARRQQVQYQRSGTGFQTSAAPQRTTVRQSAAQATAATALAQSLGVASDNIEAYRVKEVAKKTKEQEQKLEYYVNAFKDSQETGAVTAAQVGEVFPETVPIIRSRISELVGGKQAMSDLSPFLEEFANNENLKYDEAGFNAWINNTKTSLLESVAGNGDDFFIGGYSTKLNNQFAAMEVQARNERAAYQQTLQEQGFGDELDALFKVHETKDIDGEWVNFIGPIEQQQLKQLDEKWKNSSGLDNVKRNEIIVDRFTEAAYTFNDPDILLNIPKWAVNSKTKSDIEETRIKITKLRQANWTHKNAVREQERKDNIRAGKATVNSLFVDGKLDTSENIQKVLFNYRDQPEVTEFILKNINTSLIPTEESQRNARQLELSFVESAWVLDSDNIAMTKQSMLDFIYDSPNINASDKAALADKIDDIRAGLDIANDPQVKAGFTTYIKPQLTALFQKPGFKLYGLSGSTEVTRVYYNTVMESVQEFMAENGGSAPTANMINKIIDAAVDEANIKITKLLTIENTSENISNARQQSRSIQRQDKPSVNAEEKPSIPEPQTTNPLIGTKDFPHNPQNAAEFEAIPDGDFFRNPDGKLYKK